VSIDDVLAATCPKEKWGIGKKDTDGSWGMSHGPFLTEKGCLEINGSDGDHILLLNGKTEMIKYYWHEVGWINYDIEEL